MVLILNVSRDLQAVVAAATASINSEVSSLEWDLVGVDRWWTDSYRRFDCCPNGDIIAGGLSRSGVNQELSSIFRWDGASWETLGSVLPRPVRTLTVDALPVDSNGDIIAAGGFTGTRGGSTTGYVVRWNGTSWEPLGDVLYESGSDRGVLALIVDSNSDLVAGGSFDQTGNGSRLNQIARWSGTSWEPIGSGFNSRVESLTLDGDGDLIAGGRFATSGDFSVDLDRIGRWNGTSWEAIGRGFDANATVYSLAVDAAGSLTAGGGFTSTADASVLLTNIAQWGVPE